MLAVAKIFAKIFATLAFRGSKAMESNQQQLVHRVPIHCAVNYRELLLGELFVLASIRLILLISILNKYIKAKNKITE